MQSTGSCRIGFVPVNLKAATAFPLPRILRTTRSPSLGPRAVQACPAVNVHERRIIEILAPFSLQLRCERNARGEYDFLLISEGTRIDRDVLSEFVSFMPREIWRDPRYPVVQISLPHRFIADDVAFLTQMPAWASAGSVAIPGGFISATYPAHLWPRDLNFAFEWMDFGSDFKMKRAQPLCYLFVEAESPSIPVELVQARFTPELKEYIDQITDVVKFTSGSFSLFDKAKKIRPATLLKVLNE